MLAKGKIRHVGFSFHDDSGRLRAHRRRDYDWNVAQIQMNVLDEFNQATLKTATEICREKGMGLIIMEPLRGGALAANVPADVLELYASQPVRRSPVEWAFRYLYDKPEFITILSGMSNREQVLDNLAIFDQAEPNCLTEAEKRMMTRVREIYEARVRVGCTGCEYCMPCPAGVNIPGVFRTLDRHTMFGTERQFYQDYARMQEKGTDGGRCVRCGPLRNPLPAALPHPRPARRNPRTIPPGIGTLGRPVGRADSHLLPPGRCPVPLATAGSIDDCRPP